jgi:hypothetical protein
MLVDARQVNKTQRLSVVLMYLAVSWMLRAKARQLPDSMSDAGAIQLWAKVPTLQLI